MLIAVAAIAGLGWIVAAPAVAWWRHDIDHIHRRAWYWAGGPSIRTWRHAVVVAYVAFGWPAIVVVLTWRLSAQRAALLEELGTGE